MEEQKNEWWKNVDPNKPKDPNKISKGMLRKAMRAMCLNNCCAGQQTEVVECTVEDCTLFPFRRGGALNEPGNRTEKRNIWRAIREKCLNCSSYFNPGVARCDRIECELYPYRFGKALSQVTKRDIAREMENENECNA